MGSMPGRSCAVLGPRGYTDNAVARERRRRGPGLEGVVGETREDAEGVGRRIDVRGALDEGVRRDVTTVGRVSGRSWKQSKRPARSGDNAHLAAGRPKKLVDVEKERAFRALARDQRSAAKARRDEAARAERERRRDIRERKERRKRAAEVTVQVSTSTARRMLKTKKGSKLLRRGEDTGR